MASELLSESKFAPGARVHLEGDHGGEPNGTVVDLVVSEYVVRFDDGERIQIPAGDVALKPE